MKENNIKKVLLLGSGALKIDVYKRQGYDSAGVALISDNRQLNVYKAKGKVSELETFVAQKDISGNIGIAHTRWATHGETCSVNAHPHYSCLLYTSGMERSRAVGVPVQMA